MHCAGVKRGHAVTQEQHAAPRKFGWRSTMNYYLGFDGGGTKTQCVVIDEHGRVVGEGVAGPSNPLRVGFNEAAIALTNAARAA
ncbi:MAG TPA: BadF/BadG/BcrA/BcrD ATPase family protein, partial [Candidatus Acidoferrales bacterium]|nr:BadF/BadG/BcrA/BcrD ATPase family protein [Candidatus Acidoferrales bacterium]